MFFRLIMPFRYLMAYGIPKGRKIIFKPHNFIPSKKLRNRYTQSLCNLVNEES